MALWQETESILAYSRQISEGKQYPKKEENILKSRTPYFLKAIHLIVNITITVFPEMREVTNLLDNSGSYVECLT